MVMMKLLLETMEGKLVVMLRKTKNKLGQIPTMEAFRTLFHHSHEITGSSLSPNREYLGITINNN